MWLINVSFLQLLGRGRSCHPGNYICVFMTWKRGTRPLCSLQQESWKTFFPPFPPVLLHFHLPDGGCALTFAGINLLVYLDFPSLICLNEINGHSCGQIYPKLELSLLGIPANGAHPKQDSTKSNNRLNNTIWRNMEHKGTERYNLFLASDVNTQRNRGKNWQVHLIEVLQFLLTKSL